MKNFRKITALLIALVMVFALAVPTMAITKDETGTLTVSGANPGDKVTFYKIVDITYQNDTTVNDSNLWKYAGDTAADGAKAKSDGIITPADIAKLANDATTTSEIETMINTFAKSVKTTNLGSKEVTVSDSGVATWTNTATAPAASNGPDAGVYIALVTDAKGTKVYSPILLSLSYDGDEFKDNAAISFTSKYNDNGTAKSSDAGVNKEITNREDGETPDAGFALDSSLDKDGKTTESKVLEDLEIDEDMTGAIHGELGHDGDEGVKTARLGATIKYRITVELPSYPEGAVNKTVWLNDTLPTGLTFNKDLKVDNIAPVVYNAEAHSAMKEAGLWKNTTEETIDLTGKYVVVKGGKIIALAEQTDAGWTLTFDYDTLDVAAPPVITYSGVVNENAEKGYTPNLNEVVYKYSNNPSMGKTHKDLDEPTDDVAEQRDEEAFFTYELILEKFNEDETINLKGAEFELYKVVGVKDVAGGETNDEKIVLNGKSVWTTNEDGLLHVSSLEEGDYYFKEITPPAGYKLSANEDENKTEVITASLASITRSYTERTYTTNASEAVSADQIGWIKDGEFLEMDAYETAEAAAADGALPGYLKSASAATVTEPARDNDVNCAYVKMKNSKNPGLPSTGGMGTYIFTVVGVALLAVACFMLIFKRRKAEK